jgi:hypothetical protein
VYIQAKQTDTANCLKIVSKNEGSVLDIYIANLVDGRTESEMSKSDLDDSGEEIDRSDRRESAGVQIDTKKLALYLSGLLLSKDQMRDKKEKVCFQIEHNKCLKLTLDFGAQAPNTEKMHQSLLLLHSLNN